MRDGMTAANLLASLESVKTMCTIYPDADLMDEAVALALDNRHPVYDCLYLALAIERREPLLTADRKLAELARGSGVDAVLLEVG
jgi:predicted nucleic acid-binding protein